MRFTKTGPLDTPVPTDLFRWYALLGPAAVRHAWPRIERAIDDAHAERVAEQTDWPKGVMGSAAARFAEFSLPYETLLTWAGSLWGQQERRS